MNQATNIEQDGARLKAKFDFLKSEKGTGKAEFARTYKVPGGASMISQHISGHRPISLEAAVVYMTGFGCPMEEISPALAAQLPKENQSNQALAPVNSAQDAINNVADALQLLAQSISISASKGSDALAGTLVSLSKDPANPIYTDMLIKMLQPPARPPMESKDIYPAVPSIFTKTKAPQ